MAYYEKFFCLFIHLFLFSRKRRREETGWEKGRERDIYNFPTYLCIHWLILVCSWLGSNLQLCHIGMMLQPNNLPSQCYERIFWIFIQNGITFILDTIWVIFLVALSNAQGPVIVSCKFIEWHKFLNKK